MAKNSGVRCEQFELLFEVDHHHTVYKKGMQEDAWVKRVVLQSVGFYSVLTNHMVKTLFVSWTVSDFFEKDEPARSSLSVSTTYSIDHDLSIDVTTGYFFRFVQSGMVIINAFLQTKMGKNFTAHTATPLEEEKCTDATSISLAQLIVTLLQSIH